MKLTVAAMQETTETWPRKITRSGVSAKIYRIKNRGRTAYQVARYIGNRRLLNNFVRYNDARAYADDAGIAAAN